jgi:hypothetical protein
MAEKDMACSAEFSPSAFYEELSSSINQQIDIQIESFQKELLAVSVSSQIFDWCGMYVS